MQTRIAPTPSGYLHIGNACSFLLTRHLANRYGGTLRLRIDDIDGDRTRPAYLADIFEVLCLLEMDYEQGPQSVTDFEKNYSQHLRLPLYNALLADLCSTGRVYACTCSRSQLQQQNGQCLCRQKNIPLSTPSVAWRLQVADETVVRFTDEKLGCQQIKLTSLMPDFVVRKKDGLPAYQIASLADDVYYGIDYIVRGQDLLPSTAAQFYLAQLTGRTTFIKSRFFHHPLLTNAKGVKYSKSAGDIAVRSWEAPEKMKKILLETVSQWLA